jgi:hypothetical protein
MKRLAFPLVLATCLSGCGLINPGGQGTRASEGPENGEPASAFAPAVATTAFGAQSVSPSALDTTSREEKAVALAKPASAGERALGTAVVALGPPADQGLWFSSPLVPAVAQGRVVTASGQSLAVELRPGTGAPLLSLAAFQALKLPLTGLPEVTVYGP